MTTITKPGIYDLDIDTYHHREVCPTPSLSATGIKTLTQKCPAYFWHNSRLNPDFTPLSKKCFDFGKAAHSYILEGGILDDYVFVRDDLNMNTNEAKKIKAEALIDKKTVLKEKDLTKIKEMAEAIHSHPIASFAFKKCQAEKSLVWQDKETGIWLRCRPDILPQTYDIIPDYKTSVTAKPADFERQVWNFGYHQQAAHYLDGVAAVTGHDPRNFLFIVQEKEAPYLVSAITLDDDVIEWGRLQNRQAIRTFAECLKKDIWPDYADDIVSINLPAYARKELTEKNFIEDSQAFAPLANGLTHKGQKDDTANFSV